MWNYPKHLVFCDSSATFVQEIMIFDVVQLFVKKERQCVLLKRFNLKSIFIKKNTKKK